MSLRILVICDNGSFGAYLSELLTAAGHAVALSPHSEEAIRKVRRASTDLIVADVDAATLAGPLARKIHTAFMTQDIPAIVISDAVQLQEEILDVFDFIPKPFDPKRLLDGAAHLCGPPGPAEVELGEAEYALFRDHLLSLTGLHFEVRNRSSLARGLRRRMAVLRIDTFSRYFRYLQRHGEDRHELQKLLRFLTVGETHFFRYHAQFDAFRSELVASSDRRRMRFWSAGCSTGEEPYSMAIALIEAFPDWRERDLRIYATDINNHSLKRAREGVYSSWALRSLEPRYLERYFTRVGESYLVRPELRELVRFSHLNLANLDFSRQLDGELNELDAVFCRNVMIYFSREQAGRMLESFARSLREGGQLFLGHAETIGWASPSFESRGGESCFYYVKSAPPAELPPPPPAAQPERDLLEQARELFEAEEYAAAQKLLDRVIAERPADPRPLVLKGFILAGRGELDHALELCSRALSRDDLLPEGYFLRGLILDATERLEEAASEYRKAVLLDRGFVMPRYYRARLCLKVGKKEEAAREIRNSIRILDRADDALTIPYSGGMTRAVCMMELQSTLARIA